MNNGYIGVIDSGIGGISFLLQAEKIGIKQNFLYYGDNKNAPYGSKSKKELLSLTLNNLERLKRYKLNGLIVACNTLSLTCLKEINEYVGVKTFGVFPPIETPLLMGYKTLLLATPLTCEKFTETKNLKILPLPHLAKDIEQTPLDKIDLKSHIKDFNISVEALVLGCTHYYFEKNGLIDHFNPKHVYYGEQFTAKKLKENVKPIEKYSRFQIEFIGENAEKNFKFWQKVRDCDTKFKQKN